MGNCVFLFIVSYFCFYWFLDDKWSNFIFLQGMIGLLVRFASRSLLATSTLYELNINSILGSILRNPDLSRCTPHSYHEDFSRDKVMFLCNLFTYYILFGSQLSFLWFFWSVDNMPGFCIKTNKTGCVWINIAVWAILESILLDWVWGVLCGHFIF